MKLFYSKGACSLAVRILLNELNVECQFERVDLKTKKTETSRDFLEINPKGSVPVLELEEGQFLTENSAIQQYLADRYYAFELLPEVNDFKRYRVLEWLNFMSTEIHKGFGPLFSTQVPDQDKEEIFKPALKKKFEFIENHLKNSPYLLDQFTLPDAYLFVMLRWLPHFKMDMSIWPKLTNYFEGLKKRPSIQKALHDEGLQQ